MIKYAIRHKATGLFMPRGKNDGGYSHWKPGTPKVDRTDTDDYKKWQPKDGMYNEIEGSIRLLETEAEAKRVIVQWARGMVERAWVGEGYEQEERLEYTNPGRKGSDLEVVPMMVDPVVLAQREAHETKGT